MSTSRIKGKQKAKTTETESKQRPQTRAQAKKLGLQLVELVGKTESSLVALPDSTSKQNSSKPAFSKRHFSSKELQRNSTKSRGRPSSNSLPPISRRKKVSKPQTRQNDQVRHRRKPSSKPPARLPAFVSQTGLRRSNRIAAINVDDKSNSKNKTEHTKVVQPGVKAKISNQVSHIEPIDHAGVAKTRPKDKRFRRPGLDVESTNNVSRTQPKASATVGVARSQQRSPSDHSGTEPASEKASQRSVNNKAEATVTSWLSNVATGDPSLPPQPPPDLSFQMPRRKQNADGLVGSSSSVSNKSSATDGGGKSVQTNTTAKPKVPDDRRLNQHFIETNSSPDPGIDDFDLHETQLGTPVQQLSLSSLQSYFKLYAYHFEVMKNLISTASHSSGFSEDDAFQGYESSLQELLEWRPPGSVHRPWSGVTSNEFKFDQSHCLQTNEADFQRTSMMTLVDRYDFQDCFEFSCEDSWNTGEHRLPPRPKNPDSTLPAPKPDLMICFKGDAIEPDSFERADAPDELLPCLYPGNNKNLTKMIPFFFIEVKRQDSSLKGGFERNLNSASQALYNIHQLARTYPDLVERFFREIRVFSIDANVREMNLRIHRAELMRDGSGILTYRFHELYSLPKYERHNACHLVKMVLLNYAKEKLLPFIQVLFKRLLQDQPSSASSVVDSRRSKRKQQSSARNGTTQGAEGAEQSFNDVEDGGSQTPRLQSASTGMTDSFRSQIELDGLEEQPSPKRRKPTGTNTQTESTS